MAKISATLTWGPDGVGADVDTCFDGSPSDVIFMLSNAVIVYSQEIQTDPERLLLAIQLGVEELKETKYTSSGGGAGEGCS